MARKEGANPGADFGGGPAAGIDGPPQGGAFSTGALSHDCILHKKLLLLLHKACSEIRGLVRAGQADRVFDLADAVEFIPETMLNWYGDAEAVILATMRGYQKKYKGMGGFDYVTLLTLDEPTFREYYLREGYEPDLSDPQVREFIYGPGPANCSVGKDEHQ